MPTLKPCPESPNCVSTQTDQADKKMEAIPFAGDPQKALAAIKMVVAKMPRTELKTETENSLHFTFTSAIFRFVDDVEFLVDSENQAIHFRSASRTGYSDLGVNRKRMSQLVPLILDALK